MPKIIAGKSILLVLGIALALTLTVTVFVQVNEVQAQPTTTPPWKMEDLMDVLPDWEKKK